MAISNKILIVEDAADIRLLLMRFFKSEGYTIDVASNGQEALKLLQSQSDLPRVILLDLMMPVMDGFQFRDEQVKDARLAGIPVLLMSADTDIATKAQKIGAKQFLKKPLHIDSILKSVAYFCH